MFTRIADARRDYSKPFLTSDSEILEIGPFNNPTFRRESGEQVWYMDMFSKAELAEQHKGNPTRPAETILDVDYVVKEPAFSEKISRRFDMLVAHHVIEHVADPVFWFRQCSALLKQGGRVFLSIPDRRYTFDYFRPVSLAAHMVRAMEEKPSKPPLWQVVDHFYYHFKVDLDGIWAGDLPTKFTSRFSLAKAVEMAKAREAIYTDTHCWVFTPASFSQCIRELVESSYIPFQLESVEDTQYGTNEFRVMLRKV
jgi:SAM-dependent methyltransferase